MKATEKFYLIVLIVLLAAVTGFTCLQFQEEPFITQLKQHLEKYYKNKPWEKVYVHTDKPFYKPGEDLWFKIYLIDGVTNTPSKKSDIVYVELISPKGTTEQKLTLQSIRGICFGTFNFAESAPGGIYKIRAYTSWMKNFGEDYLFEKDVQVQNIIYPRLLLSFDFLKENYSPGDSVKAWLKAESLDNVPLTFKTVDIDVSLQGTRYQSFRLTTDNKGKADIAFKLPADLVSNDGLINARIPWEGNTESISRSIPIVLNNLSLNFFPEGGTLVEGVPCNMAFQAVNEYGKPADIEGYITTSNNKKVAEFSSFHQGMGAFEFTPEKGMKYIAHITNPAVKKTFTLPEVSSDGYSMQIISLGERKYKARIHKPSGEKVFFTVQTGKTISFSRAIETKQTDAEFVFHSDEFPSGIGKATLFDVNGLAQCERLLFFNYDKKLTVRLKFNKEKYLPREKVEINVQTLDEKNQPVAANLSLAVVNDQLFTFADDKQHTIDSWLLMGSELKGKVHEPKFYFDPKEPQAEKALEYLLLVQGWRRYTWNDVTGDIYQCPHVAERVGDISGRVINSTNGKPVQAEVIALELGNLKRILKVNTGPDGKFTFFGGDVSSMIQILARSKSVNASNLTIELNQTTEGNIAEGNNKNGSNVLVPEVIKVKAFENDEAQNADGDKKNWLNNLEIEFPERANNKGEFVPGANDMVLQEDMVGLDEIVVVGYGVLKKADLTGAVAQVNVNEIAALLTAEQALQGRVPGISIVHNNNAGSINNIAIRGTSSLLNNQNPLYVIDGVVYDPNLTGGSLPLQNLHPDQIQSIQIVKDASLSSIYGARSANGVIIVETKNGRNSRVIQKSRKPVYAGLVISPRQLSCTKEFYYPVYEDEEIPDVREDFRSTLYWNPNVNTDESGEAKIEFNNSDELTSFRAIAEGISVNGLIGRTEEKYSVQMPFSLAAKFPAYLTFNDTVQMPLIVKNNTDEAISGVFTFVLPKKLKVQGNIPAEVNIAPNQAFTLYLPFVVQNISGKDSIQVMFTGKKYKDAFVQVFEIQPKGFPVTMSVSGKDMEKTFSFTLNKAVNGSVHAEFTVFSDLLNDLLSGVESILREPYGCFEQTSSSTYPNIMVLKYLQETENKDASLTKRARELVHKGYNRLITFETARNGYEWFGSVPAHNGLTAYGFMEFTDMSKVYNGVSDQMMKRTLDMLMSQRDGKGGFKKDSKALDEFGSASQTVTNAYIVYALSQAGIDNIEKEYSVAYREALQSKDPYRLALVANAAFNFDKTDEGNTALDVLNSELAKKSWDKITIDHSITRSYGKSLQVESASLYVLALLKSPDINWASVEETIKFILSSRQYGGFGSTQATILALSALTDFARLSKQTSESGDILVLINGKGSVTEHFEKGDKGRIVIKALEDYLHEGENTVTVRFSNTKTPLPFSFDAGWNSLTPQSDDNCKVALQTSVSEPRVKTGETVRLNVQLSNKSRNGIPMTLAVIGIPSGLSVQPWQLKEMQEKNLFDYYEVSKNYLVIYYRQMLPSEEKNLNFDLKAEIPGVFQAPASTAYLYYTNEFRNWTDGETIEIVSE